MDCSAVRISEHRGTEPGGFGASLHRVGASPTPTTRPVGFDSLVADLATRCATAPPERLDAVVHETLYQVGEALTFDRCVAHVPDGADRIVRPKFVWTRDGVDMPAEDVDGLVAFPSLMTAVRAGQTVSASSLDECAGRVDRESFASLGARSFAAVPLALNGARGALVVDVASERTWTPDVLASLHLVAAVIGQVLVRKRDHERMAESLEELRQQRTRVSLEEAILRRDLRAMQPDRTIAAESVTIRRVLDQVRQVSPTSATVLLLGETGVGKEVFAQAIHNMSPRQRRQMVKVSCAAIPAALIESELFGRERGAFTGALSRQIGRFEAANGSTIFLDEIGDLPLDIQVKLLRVI